MRVALFGGSFDPPHHGHLAIATAAADALRLDSVLFAPVGRQPLKLDGTVTSFEDRLAMVKLACLEDPRFMVSEIDAPRADGLPNYTVDTLSELARRMPGAKLFNLVGADSFLSLPKWHEAQRLLELAEWIVVSRPGFAIVSLSSLGLGCAKEKIFATRCAKADFCVRVDRMECRFGSCEHELPGRANRGWFRVYSEWRKTLVHEPD